MLDNVLMISRDETVGLPCNRTPMDVVTFCRTIIEEIDQTTGGTHRMLFVPEGDCSNCEVDEKLLRQIVTNLLTNAVKYSPAGSAITLRLIHENQQVIIQVQDEGIGIPEEDQARLFQDFHRGNNVGAISGTGLGLSIVKRAAQAHGGSVSVESTVGVGTTFTVRLSAYETHPDVDTPELTVH
jgi:signal transduction histidine kinase